jgi:hypothetical protein
MEAILDKLSLLELLVFFSHGTGRVGVNVDLIFALYDLLKVGGPVFQKQL